MCIGRKSDDGQAEGKAKRAAAQREDDMTGRGHRYMMIETAMGMLPQTKTYLRLSAARGGKKAPFPRVTGKHILRSLYCRVGSWTPELWKVSITLHRHVWSLAIAVLGDSCGGGHCFLVPHTGLSRC